MIEPQSFVEVKMWMCLYHAKPTCTYVFSEGCYQALDLQKFEFNLFLATESCKRERKIAEGRQKQNRLVWSPVHATAAW